MEQLSQNYLCYLHQPDKYIASTIASSGQCTELKPYLVELSDDSLQQIDGVCLMKRRLNGNSPCGYLIKRMRQISIHHTTTTILAMQSKTLATHTETTVHKNHMRFPIVNVE